MLLLGKRLFTHPSMFIFNHVMNASGTKSLKLCIRNSLIVVGSITEAKQRRDRFIIGWVTAW